MNRQYNELLSSILNHYYKNNSNLVFSPLSIWIILELLKDSTGGKSKEELTNQLLKDEELSITVNNNLYIANALFCKEKYKDTIKNEYINYIDKKYDAKLFSSNRISDDINNWVKKKTHGTINQIIDDDIDIDLSLLNAISFIGKWQEPYPLYCIEKRIFHNFNCKNKRVDFMCGSEDYYVENDYVIGFIKPYSLDHFSFMAILPKDEKEDLKNIIIRINLQELYNSKLPHYLSVYTSMPKFKVESSISLPSFLMKNRVISIFNNEADFSPMTNAPLVINDIKHKTYIEVDNEGTKAVSTTAVEAKIMGMPDFNNIIKINLDRPFIYAVMHNETGLPVFVGYVNELS